MNLRNVFLRFSLPFFILCVSVPLWFKNAKAQSLPPETEKQIRAILNSPELKQAHVGISILDLGTVRDASTFPARPHLGKPYRVLFEQDAEKKFMPASNMKLFTAAIVLKLLGKDRTFPTKVFRCPQTYSRESDFSIVGGGDPSLDDDNLRDLAHQLRQAGIKEIPLITIDGSAFGAETFDRQFPSGWTMDDAIWYYGAPVSALAVNRNQIDVTVVGGDKAGDVASIVGEIPDDVSIGVLTGGAELLQKNEDELLKVERNIDSWRAWPNGREKVRILGEVAPRQKISLGLAVPNVGTWQALQVLSQLHMEGIQSQSLTTIRVYHWDHSSQMSHYSACEIVAQYNSPPLSVLFQRLLKNSDNLYAEMLLRDAAYYYDGTGGDKAGPRAHELLKKWLIAQGIATNDLRFEDGSGLSRYNLLTPRATAQLLAAINAMNDGEVIYHALPIAGRDGTLKNRMKSTPAEGNARAKTGTFSIASNLSGYVTTRDGHRLAVALYINFARDTKTAQRAQDRVFAALAGASWK